MTEGDECKWEEAFDGLNELAMLEQTVVDASHVIDEHERQEKN